MWCRVFAPQALALEPAELLQQLHEAGFPVQGHFRGDEQGWFSACLHGGELELLLERYLVREEELRGEINTWAAWLEQQGAETLMAQVIATHELITLEVPAGGAELAETVCRLLARRTGGMYQIDGRGFCTADGQVLVREDG